MKYLSVILFLGLMYWTWNLSRIESPVSQQVHIGIQDELKRLISDYIQQNLPSSRNLRFDRFYTENLDESNRVKANFTYSFDDESQEVGSARIQIEGFAILNRLSESATKSDWSFDELVILNNEVDFKDPIRITPNGPPPEKGG